MRDQYSFVRQGIPAVMVSPGFKSDDPALQPQKYSSWKPGDFLGKQYAKK